MYDGRPSPIVMLTPEGAKEFIRLTNPEGVHKPTKEEMHERYIKQQEKYKKNGYGNPFDF